MKKLINFFFKKTLKYVYFLPSLLNMKIMLCFQDPTKSLDVLIQIWIIYEILIDFQKWYYSLVDICNKNVAF